MTSIVIKGYAMWRGPRRRLTWLWVTRWQVTWPDPRGQCHVNFHGGATCSLCLPRGSLLSCHVSSQIRAMCRHSFAPRGSPYGILIFITEHGNFHHNMFTKKRHCFLIFHHKSTETMAHRAIELT